MYSVTTKTYTAPPFCEREALRYAGCKSCDNEIIKLFSQCVKEAEHAFKYKVCYIKLPLSVSEDECCFRLFKLQSQKLADNLKGCREVIIFAATVGVEIDRLIAKYSRLSPAKALFMQAIGAERIEALCDRFCDEISAELKCGTKPRFSPGYGDLPLDAQKQLFSVLDCERKLGISLNESLLMSPSKSVTAIMGLSDTAEEIKTNKCSLCNKSNCIYRCI